MYHSRAQNFQKTSSLQGTQIIISLLSKKHLQIQFSLDGKPAKYHALDEINSEEFYEVQKYEDSLRGRTITIQKSPPKLMFLGAKRQSKRIAKRKTREEKNADEYEVEKIVGQKMIRGVRHFEILWKNYPASAATWEKEVNLSNCSRKLKEFLKDSK